MEQGVESCSVIPSVVSGNVKQTVCAEPSGQNSANPVRNVLTGLFEKQRSLCNCALQGCERLCLQKHIRYGEEQSEQTEEAEKSETFFHPPCLVCGSLVVVAFNIAECIVEEVDYVSGSNHGEVVHGVSFTCFVNNTDAVCSGSKLLSLRCNACKFSFRVGLSDKFAVCVNTAVNRCPIFICCGGNASREGECLAGLQVEGGVSTCGVVVVLGAGTEFVFSGNLYIFITLLHVVVGVVEFRYAVFVNCNVGGFLQCGQIEEFVGGCLYVTDCNYVTSDVGCVRNVVGLRQCCGDDTHVVSCFVGSVCSCCVGNSACFESCIVDTVYLQCAVCCRTAHGVTGNCNLAFVNAGQVVQVFCSLQHGKSVGTVGSVGVVSVSGTVDNQHEVSTSYHFDGVLKLHFTVVVQAVCKHNCGSGVFRRCLFGGEKNSRFNFATNGVGSFNSGIGGGQRNCAAVSGITKIFHFGGKTAGLDKGAEKRSDNNKYKADSQHYYRTFIGILAKQVLQFGFVHM